LNYTAIHQITIYTDGSCHTQKHVGAWVAILLTGAEKLVLSGCMQHTTHQRMELMAVMNAIEYIRKHYVHIRSIHVITDSQYVAGLPAREPRLRAAGFITKKGTKIQNADLVEPLLLQLSTLSITFEKVKAHQKPTAAPNFNIEADILSRKLVRDYILYTIANP
jgi:ribonuclease HI